MLSGSVSQDEKVLQYPQGRRLRIRGLQNHGQEVRKVNVGQRAALNLAGTAKEEIQRGDQLAHPESLLNSFLLNVSLTLLEDVLVPMKNRDRVRVYLGSKEVFGRAVFLEGKTLSPGKTALVQLRLENLISSSYGDRFIIRNFSPVITIGGGMVIDPSPGKSKRILHKHPERLRRLYDGDENIRSEEVIYLQSVRGVMESDFLVRSGLSGSQSGKVLQLLQIQKKVLCVEPLKRRYLHVEHVARIGKFLSKALELFHKKFPDREGMTFNELGGKLYLVFSEKEVENLLKYLVKVGLFSLNDQYISLVEHQPQVSQTRKDCLDCCLELIKSGGFQPLRRTHLLRELGLNEMDGITLLKSAAHSKRIVRVAEDLHYVPEQINTILKSLKFYFSENPNITVVQFKELLNISRKHAIDLLEYFDSQQLTIRKDNHRIPAKILTFNE